MGMPLLALQPQYVELTRLRPLFSTIFSHGNPSPIFEANNNAIYVAHSTKFHHRRLLTANILMKRDFLTVIINSPRRFLGSK